MRCASVRLTPTICELPAGVCKTLPGPTRQRIIDVLGDGEMPTGGIARLLGLRKANVFPHLAVMPSMGIVQTRKEGRQVFYRLTSPKITETCQLVRDVILQQLAERRDLLKAHKGS